MENLNRENFWDELQKIYTEEIQSFYYWIHAYKRQNNWYKLFNDQYRKEYVERAPNGEICKINYEAPKYYDLPIAMQIGIFIQYTQETKDDHEFEFSPDIRDMEVFAQSIKDWFHKEHEWAKNDNLSHCVKCNGLTNHNNNGECLEY